MSPCLLTTWRLASPARISGPFLISLVLMCEILLDDMLKQIFSSSKIHERDAGSSQRRSWIYPGRWIVKGILDLSVTQCLKHDNVPLCLVTSTWTLSSIKLTRVAPFISQQFHLCSNSSLLLSWYLPQSPILYAIPLLGRYLSASHLSLFCFTLRIPNLVTVSTTLP